MGLLLVADRRRGLINESSVLVLDSLADHVIVPLFIMVLPRDGYDIAREVSKRLGPFCFVHIIIMVDGALALLVELFELFCAGGNHGGSQWREMPRNN